MEDNKEGMEKRQDPGPQTDDVYTESTASKVVFIGGVTLVSLFTGLALNLGLAGRRYRMSLKQKPGESGHEDPVLLASRALAWGTAYAVLGTGLLLTAGVGVWKLASRCACLHDSF